VYPTKRPDWAALRWPEYALVAATCIGAYFASRDAGIAVGASSAVLAACFVVRFRRARSGVVLRVAGGDLYVRIRGRERQVPLREIEAVELDTREIERVEREGGVVGQLTGQTRVAPPSNESRIVLRLAEPHPPIALTDDRIRHSEALEWMGKIRVFLRGQGWLPETEREEGA